MRMVTARRSQRALRTGAYWLVFCAGCALAAACGDNIATDAAASPDGGGDAAARPPKVEIHERDCEIGEGDDAPDFLLAIGCRADFDALASEPLDASIPGARSVKVVLDQLDGDKLYFQNSGKYQIHHQFAVAHLSGNGKPIVPALDEFNRTEYYSPDRRFVLGAVTYYEGPDAWALEIAPYDKATPAMIDKLYAAIAEAAYFGPALRFHPTSATIETTAGALSDSVVQISTDELFADTRYQPLNLGTAIGRLRFMEAADLATEYVGFRDLLVLDRVPNDISVIAGLITEEFQTPLSHVNVLSQNRKTPNMGLRNATTDQELRALEGKWVRLTVGAFEYTVEEVTTAAADTFWEEHKPDAVGVPRLDTSITELRDIEELVDEEGDGTLRDQIKAAIPAFGGKASHYSILARTEHVNAPKAFAIPVYYYVQFMEQNGFTDMVNEWLEDPAFNDDPETRDMRLAQLRAAMMDAPVDQELQDTLRAKLDAEFPATNMRFRSSTNAEDLDGFTGAGLYTSKTGASDDWEDVLDALREVWGSVWFFRAFEERAYRSIDHRAVGMALLVHHSFPDEEANGVALTANPFDPSGLEPGFYVNVQFGEASVVAPDAETTTDQFIHHFSLPGAPVVYRSHSSMVPERETVLTTAQIQELGRGLDAVHKRFSPAYGPAAGNQGWYAMDVEFKFDGEPGETPKLAIKQARPHPGRGQ